MLHRCHGLGRSCWHWAHHSHNVSGNVHVAGSASVLADVGVVVELVVVASVAVLDVAGVMNTVVVLVGSAPAHANCLISPRCVGFFVWVRCRSVLPVC